jgi:glutamine synthetase
VLSDPTVGAFERYNVLSRRELESRQEVWTEQYVIRANIEAETMARMARTVLLPAALRHLKLTEDAGMSGLASAIRSLVDELAAVTDRLDQANVYPDGVEGLELAEFARDSQLAAMANVREVADRLEKVVADDLWPLPKYEEILFIR